MRKNIGPYEIEDMVGHGGMGTVYRGRDPRFDRAVAIKTIHSHLLYDEGVGERFRAEAVIQAKLGHPNVVTVLDFISEDEILAMVMEYIDGSALEQMIARDGPLPVASAVDICRQVLSALARAHEVGLVHRDIKPSNILVQHLDRREHVKVVDFGVAKILGDQKFRTATTAKMGTLAYMSPEHLKSPKYVDQRTDIYSTGVVLYEALTGRVPFDAESEFELMRKVIEEQPETPSRTLNGLPAGLEQVMLKALAKDPDDRYQTAAELDCDLVEAVTLKPEVIVKEIEVVKEVPAEPIEIVREVEVVKEVPAETIEIVREVEVIKEVPRVVEKTPDILKPAMGLITIGLVIAALIIGFGYQEFSHFETRIANLDRDLSRERRKLVEQTEKLVEQAVMNRSLKLIMEGMSWDIALRDDFSRGLPGWSLGEREGELTKRKKEIRNGRLSWVATAKKGFHGKDWPFSSSANDFYLSTMVQRKKNIGYAGLLLRSIDNDNFYTFRIGESSFIVSRLKNNSWETVVGWKNAEINATDWNKLAVLARGEILTFFINDRIVAAAEDDRTKKRGRVGIVIELSEGQNGEFLFDDFVLRKPPTD